MVNARPDTYQWVPNTPSGVPGNGDIVVWGTGVGAYGHTAVFIDGDANNFRSFDQNWPTGSAAHVQNHNYNGVLGWLHIPNAPSQGGNNMETKDQLEQRLLHGPGGLDEYINKYSASQALVQQLTDRVNEQQKALDKANALITKLQADNNSAALTKQVEALQKQIADLQNSTPTTLDSFSLGQLLSAAFSKLFKIK